MKWLDRDLITGPYLFLALSERDLHKALRKLAVPRDKWPLWLADTSLGNAIGLVSGSGNFASIVCMRPKEGGSAIENAGTLIHEAVHVFQQFCNHIGEREPSIEFEAYAIEAIAKRLMKAYADTLPH